MFRVRVKEGVGVNKFASYGITSEWKEFESITSTMSAYRQFGEIEIQQIVEPEPEKINAPIGPQPKIETQKRKSKPKKKSTRKR